MSNAFTPGSPLANFLGQSPSAAFTVCGTMSKVMPAVIRMEVPHRPAVYIKRGPAGYEPIDKMTSPIIMEARLQMDPAGVMVKYPRWAAKVLSAPTTTITER